MYIYIFFLLRSLNHQVFIYSNCESLNLSGELCGWHTSAMPVAEENRAKNHQTS